MEMSTSPVLSISPVHLKNEIEYKPQHPAISHYSNVTNTLKVHSFDTVSTNHTKFESAEYNDNLFFGRGDDWDIQFKQDVDIFCNKQKFKDALIFFNQHLSKFKETEMEQVANSDMKNAIVKLEEKMDRFNYLVVKSFKNARAKFNEYKMTNARNNVGEAHKNLQHFREKRHNIDQFITMLEELHISKILKEQPKKIEKQHKHPLSTFFSVHKKFTYGFAKSLLPKIINIMSVYAGLSDITFMRFANVKAIKDSDYIQTSLNKELKYDDKDLDILAWGFLTSLGFTKCFSIINSVVGVKEFNQAEGKFQSAEMFISGALVVGAVLLTVNASNKINLNEKAIQTLADNIKKPNLERIMDIVPNKENAKLILNQLKASDQLKELKVAPILELQKRLLHIDNLVTGKILNQQLQSKVKSKMLSTLLKDINKNSVNAIIKQTSIESNIENIPGFMRDTKDMTSYTTIDKTVITKGKTQSFIVANPNTESWIGKNKWYLIAIAICCAIAATIYYCVWTKDSDIEKELADARKEEKEKETTGLIESITERVNSFKEFLSGLGSEDTTPRSKFDGIESWMEKKLPIIEKQMQIVVKEKPFFTRKYMALPKLESKVKEIKQKIGDDDNWGWKETAKFNGTTWQTKDEIKNYLVANIPAEMIKELDQVVNEFSNKWEEMPKRWFPKWDTDCGESTRHETNPGTWPVRKVQNPQEQKTPEKTSEK